LKGGGKRGKKKESLSSELGCRERKRVNRFQKGGKKKKGDASFAHGGASRSKGLREEKKKFHREGAKTKRGRLWTGKGRKTGALWLGRTDCPATTGRKGQGVPPGGKKGRKGPPENICPPMKNPSGGKRRGGRPFVHQGGRGVLNKKKGGVKVAARVEEEGGDTPLQGGKRATLKVEPLEEKGRRSVSHLGKKKKKKGKKPQTKKKKKKK